MTEAPLELFARNSTIALFATLIDFAHEPQLVASSGVQAPPLERASIPVSV